MVSQTPLFLQLPSGHTFATLYTPASGSTDHWIICLPPFAEEMNKSRKILRDQAEQFAEQGWSVLVPDLQGTGDSVGSFAQSSVAQWQEDLAAIIEHLSQQDVNHISLWGVRMGALLMPTLVARFPDMIQHLILWQPVISGEQLMTQFLRIRVAASMMSGQQETVSGLRAEILAGEFIEVGGYPVSATFLQSMDALQLATLPNVPTLQIHWFEVVTQIEKALLPLSKKLVNQWREQNRDVSAQTLLGEPFWSAQEQVKADNLITETTRMFAMVAKPHRKEVTLPTTSVPYEQPLTFACGDDRLLGMIHQANKPAKEGVLIIVGGPQYRIGSHRQFILLARSLAKAGIPVMRFDYRGMGDATGELLGFEHIQEDINAAINAFMSANPDLEKVTLWGLCDAATAAAFYAPQDDRVNGLVMLNPWVRSDEGEAQAYLKHYYWQRLTSKAFWTKLLSGEVRFIDSLTSLFDKVWRVLAVKKPHAASTEQTTEAPLAANLPQQLTRALATYKHDVLIICSGHDLTAQEFTAAVAASSELTALLQRERCTQHTLSAADHTFSRQAWREKVEQWTCEWMETR